MAEKSDNNTENMSETNTSLSLKDLLTKTAFIYGLLIFLGLYEKKSWFDNFGIAIYDYISIEEILISFLPLIISILSKLIWIFIFYIISNFVVNKIFGKMIIKNEILINFIIKSLILLIISSYFHSFQSGYKGLSNYKLLIDNYYFLLSLFSFIIIWGLFSVLPIYKIKKVHICYYLVLALCFIAIQGIPIKTKLQYNSINNGSLQHVYFDYQKYIINTENDKNLKFIGNLNNYIFIYDTVSHYTNVYPIKDLTNLKIKKN